MQLKRGFIKLKISTTITELLVRGFMIQLQALRKLHKKLVQLSISILA
jgi:hypothetical protein